MPIKGILFGWCLLAFHVCLSQENDSIDHTYIKRYPDHFFVWPVLKRRSLNFAAKDLRDKRSVEYQPNNSYSVGIGSYIFDLAFEVTFAIPVNERNEQIFGKSKARDFQINALNRNWGADIYYQKYTGFYTNNDLSLNGDEPYPHRADIVTRNVGLTFLYVFDAKKYSLRSAFNFSERQLVSGGSFILTGTINSFKLSADSAVLDARMPSDYGSFKKLRYTTFSIAPGYAYTWVRKNFFLSGALTAGPAHNWIYYQNEDNQTKNDIQFNSFASVRLGMGYSNDWFFTGLNFVQQSRRVRFDDFRFTNNSSTFRLLVGFRFREFGVLRKSAWDLPRELMSL
jgi:Domain of unknown function (DUF4421)